MTTPTSAPGRIVVGIDGSSHSVGALRWALRQAVLTGAQLDAVACWRTAPMVGDYAPVGYVDLDLTGPTGDHARDAVADAVAATPGAAQVSVHTRVVQGYPTVVLLEAAVGADLLVVGSRGHGELSGMMLGSVGLHCATHASCPVLIVHEPADANRA